MFRTAVRRKSWRCIPGTAAAVHAATQEPSGSRPGAPLPASPVAFRPGAGTGTGWTAELALQPPHTLHLGAEERLELRGEVHDAPLVVLRRAGVQAQRAGLAVELATLEREDLALRSPTCRRSPRPPGGRGVGAFGPRRTGHARRSPHARRPLSACGGSVAGGVCRSRRRAGASSSASRARGGSWIPSRPRPGASRCRCRRRPGRCRRSGGPRRQHRGA